MFGLGVPELLFIMALALLVFGPKRLPQIGRTLGKGMAEFRRASTELQRSINLDLDGSAQPPAPDFKRPPRLEPANPPAAAGAVPREPARPAEPPQAAGEAGEGEAAPAAPASSQPPS
jgi:TatA/E family protein of Tat protein translocase